MEYTSEQSASLMHGEDGFASGKKPRDMDRFFQDMYFYYVSKGIGAIVLSQFCELVTLGFTILFSVFVFGFVDWEMLVQCHDEETCASNLLFINPFQESPTKFRFFLLVYLVLFLTLWIWRLVVVLGNVSNAFEMSNFYSTTLGVTSVEIQHMEWCEVVDRLIFLHGHRKCIVSTKPKLSAHDVVLRVMRKENYLVGLINKDTLDLFVPWWISPFASEKLFLTKSLEWSLSFCIMDYMFTEDFTLSTEFLEDLSGLQWRFQVVGLIHFLLLPFMLIFMAVHFFLQNAQQFHSSKAYLGPRQWSPLAQWKFREFNELPHVFEERLNKSVAPANDYIGTFHNPYAIILARCGTYITGAFIAALLLVSVLSDGALLYVHIADYNLLWYLGIFSACYAGARSLIPDETKVQESADTLLKRVSAHTHYFPDRWEGRLKSLEVKDEVCELFQYKAQIFLMEVLSVVLTPAVLCFSLPACAENILVFIRDHTKNVEGVGAVCDYSLFEFDKYGDENFGAEKSGFVEPAQRPNDGKMEKSFLNFQKVHPNFDGGAAAKTLYGRLNAFKDVKKQHRDQMLASIIEDSRMYGSRHYADEQDDSQQDPGSPVVRERRYSNQSTPEPNNAFGLTQGVGLALQPPQHTERGHVIQPQGFRIETVGDALDSSIQHPAGGTMFSRPVSVGLRLADPGKGPDMNMVNPVGPPDDFSQGNMSGGDLSVGAPGYAEYFMSAKRSISEGDLDSDIGDAMSPIIQENSGRPPSAFKPNRAAPGALPVQIEMSALANSADQQRRSEMRGFQHSAHDRSLFQSNVQGASGYQQRSRGDIPSVLLSILRQENIDYENDFYWLTQFHAEKLRNPAALEKSLVHSPAGGMRGRRMGSSHRLANSSVFGARRSDSRTPPPAFADPEQPFSPGGMSMSGLDSSAAFTNAGAQMRDLFPGNDSPPRYAPARQFVSSTSTSGSQQQAGWKAPDTSALAGYAAPAGGAVGGAGHYPSFASGRGVHGPAAGQKKSVSGLDRLAECDDVED